MGKGRPGGNPNIREIGKATRFTKGDARAVESGKKGKKAETVMRTVKDIALDKLNEDNQKILSDVTMRIIKMAADGNLPAIQYLFKIIGQDPGDLLTVTTNNLSDEAKADIDNLLRETRGEVK